MVYILLLIYLLNLIFIKKRRLFGSAFIMHFFFISLIFIGPTVYYELGGLSYSNSFEEEDLLVFEKYGIFVFSTTLIYLFFYSHIKRGLGNRFFAGYRSRNTKLTFLYFIFWYAIVLLYLLVYIRELPVVQFLFTGSLPTRLDQSEKVQLFYTFSSFFMIFIPSGYFFFIGFLRSNLAKLSLLILVAFILISGGHKGLVTYFVIFALFFSGYKFNLKQTIVAGFALLTLLSIYTVTKGRKFNTETFLYLLESPPRRFFVTQGSGFIARISMARRDLYQGDVFEYQLIKKQTFQFIYPGVRDTGAAPTMFMGDLHVRYGPIITAFAYILFLLIIFPLVKGTDNMKSRRLFLWWNLFILFYLTGTAEFSWPSFLRMLLAVGNFSILLIIPFLTLKTRYGSSE